MTSVAKSSSSRSSSSSFRSSSHYTRSSLSSIQMGGSSGTDPYFQPFLDHGSQTLLVEEPLSMPTFNNHPSGYYLPSQDDPEGMYPIYCSDTSSFGSHKEDRDSFGNYSSERDSFGGYQGDRKSCAGGYQGDRSHVDVIQAVSSGPASMTGIQMVGNSYHLSVDISRFELHDIVVMAYNHNVVIHAEKVGNDGSASDKFIHKSLLPVDMDPLSMSGTLTPDGMLLIRIGRKSKTPLTTTFHSETHH